MANIFEKLQDAQFQAEITPRTKESTEWLRKKIQRMSRINGSEVIEDLKPMNTIDIGSMVMFTYKASRGTVIRKEENKTGIDNILHPGFYDKFPILLVLDIYEREGKYIEGINLHYLAPLDRAKILDKILDRTDDDNFNPIHLYKTIAEMSRGNKIGNHPGFKRYNFANMRSRIVQVTQDEWEIAAFLPTTEFRTDHIRGPYGLADEAPSKQQVYKWSKRNL